MPQEINFLAKNKAQLEARNKSDRQSFLFISVLGSITVVFFLTLLGIQIYYRQQIEQVQKNIDAVTNQLNLDESVTATYLTFHSKLAKLEELIAQRNAGTQALRDMYLHFTTENTAVKNTTYDYYTKNVELTLSCNSVFALSQLVSLIQDSAFREKYQKIEMLSLRRSNNGNYTLEVSIEL